MTLKTIYKLIRTRFFEKKENKTVTEIYQDLELGKKVDSICENGIMNEYLILENYVSFMEIVNYLSSPLEERDQNQKFSFVIKDKNKLKDYKVNLVFPL